MSLRVRDVLEAARAAALAIRRGEEVAELRRRSIGVQGHGFEAHSKTGILDPTRKIDSVLDWEMERSSSRDLTDPIDEAREIIRGASHVTDELTVELATRYYVDAESYVEIARYLADVMGARALRGRGRRRQVEMVKAALEEKVDCWERIGIAHLKEMAR